MKKKRPLGLKADAALPEKYKNLWYVKQHDRYEDAISEVIAQEFFRLIIPGQTKTRLVKHVNSIYVASKGVKFFCSLDAIKLNQAKEGLAHGMYKGLGHVLLVAMLVNEIDLKSAHLLLDINNKLVKIDGDRCFARLEDYPQCRGFDFSITSADIDALPRLQTYHPYNWLDAVETGDYKLFPNVARGELAVNSKFREEVNQAILRALILPKAIIKEFIRYYYSDERFKSEADTLENEMLSRIDQLRHAAFENASFMTYLHSEQAKIEVDNYLNYAENFTMVGKEKLGIAQNRGEILLRLVFLRNKKEPPEAQPEALVETEVKPSNEGLRVYILK